MVGNICSAQFWGAVTAGLMASQALLEYWLGKTDKTKAASTVELLMTLLSRMVSWVLLRRKGK